MLKLTFAIISVFSSLGLSQVTNATESKVASGSVQNSDQSSFEKMEEAMNQPQLEVKTIGPKVKEKLDIAIVSLRSMKKMSDIIKIGENNRTDRQYLDRLQTIFRRCNWDPNAELPAVNITGRELKIGHETFDINPYGSVRLGQTSFGETRYDRYDDILIRILNKLGCKRENVPVGFVLMTLISKSKFGIGIGSFYSQSDAPPPVLNSQAPLHEDRFASLQIVALPKNGQKDFSYKITSVVSGGFAERIGLRANDVIVSVNKMPIPHATTEMWKQFFNSNQTPNMPIFFEIQRDGKSISIPLNLKY